MKKRRIKLAVTWLALATAATNLLLALAQLGEAVIFHH